MGALMKLARHLILLFALALLSCGDPALGGYDWVILTGDSNAMGPTDQYWPTPSDARLSPRWDVPAYYQTPTTPQRCSGESFNGALPGSQYGTQVCLQTPNGRWSVELTMIDYLKNAGLNPALIKVARGGAREDEEWVEGLGSPDMHSRLLDDALPLAAADLGPPRSVTWVHFGAHNVCGNNPGELFEPIEQLFRDVREELGPVPMLFQIVAMHPDMDDQTNWPGAYRADYARCQQELQQLAEDLPGTQLLNPALVTAIDGGNALQGDVHYRGPFLEALGTHAAKKAAARLEEPFPDDEVPQ